MTLPPVGWVGISPLEPCRKLENVKISSKTPVRLVILESIVHKNPQLPYTVNQIDVNINHSIQLHSRKAVDVRTNSASYKKMYHIINVLACSYSICNSKSLMNLSLELTVVVRVGRLQLQDKTPVV